MSQEKLQEYFDSNPVKRIARGSDVVVYAGDDLVIKNPTLNQLSLTWAQLTMDKDMYHRGGSTVQNVRALTDDARNMGLGLQQKTRDNYYEAKGRLGGLVVPYEIPDEITAKVRWRIMPVIWEKQTFYRPAVQERIPNGNMFDERLKNAAKQEDVSEIRSLLDAYIQTIELTLRRGAYTQDPLPPNYGVMPDGRVLLHDLGSIIFQKRNVVGVLKTADGQKHAVTSRDRILSLFAPLLAPLNGHPEIDKIVREFSKKFSGFFEPRAIASMGTMSKGVMVEDVKI